jgi:hypothetical protein
MHPLYEKASSLTASIIGGAIEVHRDKGPGLIESIYEWCLLKELEIRKLECVSQKRRILEIVCLNWKLDGVSLVPEWRKPFDLLAEGLQKKDSRGDRI